MRTAIVRNLFSIHVVVAALSVGHPLVAAPLSAHAADAPWIARGANGMVATDSKYASEAGKPENLGLVMEGLLPYGLSVHPDGRRIASTAGTEPHNEVWVLKDFLPALNRAK